MVNTLHIEIIVFNSVALISDALLHEFHDIAASDQGILK